MSQTEDWIRFNRPTWVGSEQEYMARAIEQGRLAGDAEFTHKCHAFLEKTLGVNKALLTTSCTHALEMAALLLDIQPGDEVIVPAFTFVSSVNAFVLRGARPIFIDVRPDTLNMDETLLEDLVTPRTRAVVPVHYGGVGCEMNAIMDVANRKGLAVVEDNAHGLLGKYQDQFLGTFGAFATQSFHETKNFSCGEGGALLINDPAHADRAEIIREKGTNRSRFFRGQVDKYTWVDLGSSYLPSDILAAILHAQFEQAATIQEKRQHVWETYWQNLGDWATANDVRLPVIPQGCQQPYHLFYLLLPSLEQRQALIAHLKEQRISAVFHYLPLHLSDMGLQLGGQPGDCPVTEELSDRLLRLPFYTDLSPADQARVIDAVRAFEV